MDAGRYARPLRKRDDGGRRLAFVIYRRADWRPIGFTAWQNLDHRQRTAEFVIGIGEADCRGQGYGTEATRLMLDYAFTALGLHSVMLTVYAPNIAGLRAYPKAGFKVCGRRRESYLMGSKLWDTVYMDCLASEFISRRLDCEARTQGLRSVRTPHSASDHQ